MRKRRTAWLSGILASVLALSAVAGAQTALAQGTGTGGQVHHVLLISVDGMHSVDLEKYIANNPGSTLAMLAHQGIRYTNASTSRPSDSFPGLLSIVTGGTPKSTGVYYDDSYDRTLVPPVVLGGTATNVTCTPNSPTNTVGTEVLLDETADKDLNRLDGGGGINPAALPRDPVTCDPVYPHSFLKVNTIFEVLKSHGYRTAWSDKHQSYDLVNGPSGKGVDDLFTPEIAAPINVGNLTGLDPVSSETAIQAYDSVKVNAIINEIDGRDHSGTNYVGAPAIFGMNFQAVSVGQKLEKDAVTGQTGGYTDAAGDPTPLLQNALDFVDQSLGRMVSELKRQGMWNDTVMIVTAKHGQAPIDPSKLNKLGDPISDVVNGVSSNVLAQQTADDVSLLWLTDSSKAGAVGTALQAAGPAVGISNPNQVLFGAPLFAQFGDPSTDPVAAAREPDVIVTPNLGVIYTHSQKKIAEHGGFSKDDTNVALLISGPRVIGSEADLHAPGAGAIMDPVNTTQIAPTILSMFGIQASELQAVQKEGTTTLPAFDLHTS